MTPLTLVAPEIEEAIEERKDSGHLPVPSDSEIQKLNEQELKAAIKSAWKKHERLAKKDMAPLLFWLRLKLRAQGSRNDIQDKDRGFGAWVEDNLDITRRTVDRWADKYGLDNGLMERKPTSGQPSKGEDPDDGEMEEHGQGFTFFVSRPLHKQYQKALKTIREHFKITDNGKAVVKGVCYAAETIAAGIRDRNRSGRSTAKGRRSGRVAAGHNR